MKMDHCRYSYGHYEIVICTLYSTNSTKHAPWRQEGNPCGFMQWVRNRWSPFRGIIERALWLDNHAKQPPRRLTDHRAGAPAQPYTSPATEADRGRPGLIQDLGWAELVESDDGS
ncbi:hypothetical protein IF2G_02543 [Cordyceps javanica]|nr:hypothetical protein IF2G_02543 [Cordyceps javanica]